MYTDLLWQGVGTFFQLFGPLSRSMWLGTTLSGTSHCRGLIFVLFSHSWFQLKHIPACAAIGSDAICIVVCW